MKKREKSYNENTQEHKFKMDEEKCKKFKKVTMK